MRYLELAGKEGQGSRVGLFAVQTRSERQADFDHQAAFWPIGDSDAAAVEAHSAIRYCQAEAHAPSLPTAGVVDAVEGTEKLIQRILGNAGSGVGHTHHSLGIPRAISLLVRFMQSYSFAINVHDLAFGGEFCILFQAQFDLGAFVGVADSVPDNVLNRAVQQTWAPDHHALVSDFGFDLAMPALRFEAGVSGNFAYQLIEMHRTSLDGFFPRFKAGDGEQFLD